MHKSVSSLQQFSDSLGSCLMGPTLWVGNICLLKPESVSREEHSDHCNPQPSVAHRKLSHLLHSYMQFEVALRNSTILREAYQAPLSMGFSGQEYWSGLPFPSPGDLPDPGLLCCRQMLYGLSHQGSDLNLILGLIVLDTVKGHPEGHVELI